MKSSSRAAKSLSAILVTLAAIFGALVVDATFRASIPPLAFTIVAALGAGIIALRKFLVKDTPRRKARRRRTAAKKAAAAAAADSPLNPEIATTPESKEHNEESNTAG
jgi:hypothetical protein